MTSDPAETDTISPPVCCEETVVNGDNKHHNKFCVMVWWFRLDLVCDSRQKTNEHERSSTPKRAYKEKVDTESLIWPENGGCWSQLNSVQSSEQPVNSSLHYLQFPLWGQYQIFRAIHCWLCGFINYWSHREHLLIMIPAEKLLVQCDTGGCKAAITESNCFWGWERPNSVWNSHCFLSMGPRLF